MNGQLGNLRGLDRFGDRLSPVVLRDIEPWKGHPELGRLIARLDSIGEPQRFLDAWAEVMVARSLLRFDCGVRVEVPTQNGRTADFEATHGGQKFYVHVKRLNSDEATQKQINLSDRMEALKKIARNLVVTIRFCRDLTDPEMQDFVVAAASFVKQAKVGEEFEFPGDGGETLVGCEIRREWDGEHVFLQVVLPTRWLADHERLKKLLHKAHRQFMPNALNVIAVTSDWQNDAEDFERALLGSTYEVGGGDPTSATVVESGREGDGFWAAQKHNESNVAAFFHFSASSDEFQSRLWVRSGGKIDSTLRHTLCELFNTGVSGVAEIE